MAEITQVIGTIRTLADAPNPLTDTQDDFDTIAYNYTLSQKDVNEDMQARVEELNEFATQVNEVKDEINTARNQVINAVSFISEATLVDAVPTNGSNNPVSSDGVFDALAGKVSKSGNETIAGVKTFSSSPIVPVPTLVNQTISMGNIIEKTGAGLGYGTGSGGTVTQLTSKSTAVTLNKPCGLIYMNNASLAAGASVNFVVYNTSYSFATRDLVLVHSEVYGGNYRVEALNYSTNYFQIRVTNITGGSLSEALEISFAIIKGAIS